VSGVLVVSPHPDDAALSVGGLLLCLEAPITLLTVFGRSNYTLRGWLERGWKRVTEIRQAEETAYARSLGARLLYPRLTDASIRFRGAVERMFPADGLPALPRRLPGVLEEALRGRPRLMLVPAGIGGHADHLAVREAARAAAAKRGLAVAFYEDLPYAATFSERRLRRHLRGLDARLEPLWIPLGGRLAEKLQRLSLYATQLGPKQVRQVAAHARRWPERAPCERLWALPPFPSLLVCA
jgi:LmbE family N-acetylglucosaminyl deacetylase